MWKQTEKFYYQLKKGWCLFFLIFLTGCTTEGDPSGPAPLGSIDFQLVNYLNVSPGFNNGKTVRFRNNTIQVFVEEGVEDLGQLTIWTVVSNGIIQFNFVNMVPSEGIIIRLGQTAPFVCATTSMFRFGEDGSIRQATITLGPLYNNPSFCRNTIAHEVGHAIGIFPHTVDGGLMDFDGGNGQVTEPVATAITYIYSIPPSTDLTPLVRPGF